MAYVCFSLMALMFTATLDLSLARHTDATHQLYKRSSGCRAYYSCALPHNRHGDMDMFFAFAFDLGIPALDRQCPYIDEGMDCGDLGCTDDGAFWYVNYVNNMTDWVCQHQEEFRAGAACWTYDFYDKMGDCQFQYGYGDVTSAPTLLECYANVPGDIPTCNDDDAELVVQFTTFYVGLLSSPRSK